jgi:hypothetical protein
VQWTELNVRPAFALSAFVLGGFTMPASKHRAILLILVLFPLTAAFPSTLSFSLPETFANIEPGETQTFYGTITNFSAADLKGSEISFQAFGLNPFLLTFTQLVGKSGDDVDIPNSQTTGVLPLFSIGLIPSALPGDEFALDVTMQDINGNLSNDLSLNLVAGVYSTPEPQAIQLCASALVLFIVFLVLRSRKRTLRRDCIEELNDWLNATTRGRASKL